MLIESLQAFVAVAYHGSFTQAADALFVNQSVITRRVQALEKELDTQLFERTSRHVALTEDGRAFLPYAQRVINAQNDGMNALKGRTLRKSNRLRIGFNHLTQTSASAKLLAQFHEKIAPSTDFGIVENDDELLIENLLAGNVDCAFLLTTDTDIVPESLNAHTVTTMREFIAMRAGHHLAVKDSLTMEDVRNEEFIFPVRQPSPISSLTLREFARLPIQPKMRFVIHGGAIFEVLKYMDCITCVTEDLVREAPGVVYRPFESPDRLTCLFLWKKNDTRPIVTQFSDFIQSRN
ncbi:MAG: LysR family transcriptional regulator [Coriobacteriales bacterium]